MATATVEFDCLQGMTLTLELYAVGSDTLVASSSASERSNDRGSYVANVSAPAGTYRVRVRTAANVTVARGILRHQDVDGTERVTDDDLSAMGSVAAQHVWTYGSRTITQSAIQIAAILSAWLQIGVDWDNGWKLMLSVPPDEFEATSELLIKGRGV
jgi:hypothetical protein